jgi:hypothetical protein
MQCAAQAGAIAGRLPAGKSDLLVKLDRAGADTRLVGQQQLQSGAIIERLDGAVTSTCRERRGSVMVEWAEPIVRDEFVAGIVFNVGRADEGLVDSGLSHLVEHLALPPLKVQRPRYGGSVSATALDLWFGGDSAEEALSLLRDACARIGAVSQERFARERLVLRAEGDRNAHPLNRGLALRYGARGLGLVGYPQVALGWLELADVRRWAQR